MCITLLANRASVLFHPKRPLPMAACHPSADTLDQKPWICACQPHGSVPGQPPISVTCRSNPSAPSYWLPVAPQGYGALGHVVSLGFDPPAEPVQVRHLLPKQHQQSRVRQSLELDVHRYLFGLGQPSTLLQWATGCAQRLLCLLLSGSCMCQCQCPCSWRLVPRTSCAGPQMSWSVSANV